ASPLSMLFVGYKQALYEMTVRAFRICSFSFLLSGMGIFGSSFFTALNDGLTSALIAFLRTLVFQIAAVFLLPLIWGVDGIWVSIVAAEAMAVAVTLFFLAIHRQKYHY
ncbi:MAG: MATE family efflux transporter, partial [Clostridia bacterium]|nr:MATE family efflux transporter [Clostridia bacterium]